MEERMPGYIVGITEMLAPRAGASYAEIHRQNKALRDHDKARLKRSKDRRNRRQQELEEEIVKTGSEDENDARYRRPHRRRKPDKHKKVEKTDKTYLGSRKGKQNYIAEYDQLYQQKHKEAKRAKKKYGTERKREARSRLHSDDDNLGNVPRVTYHGPEPDLNNIKGAVPLKSVRKKEKKMTEYMLSSPRVHVNEQMKNYSSGKETHNRLVLVESNSDSGAQSDEMIRTHARRKRAAILSRAEQLLQDRKTRYEVSSGEDGDSEKSMDKNQSIIRHKIDYPTSSDDDKYVLVKTTVSESDTEFYTDLDVPLPPMPRASRHSGKSLPSMTKSEIPVYSDEEFDVYHPQRPYTDTYRELPVEQGRYEEKIVNNDTTQKPHRTLNGKGKLVTFYRNGDEYFKGITISITPKNFLNFETLLVHLNDKIETTTGVKYIFAYPSGKEIKSVTEFQPGRCYLVSTNKKPILNITYGRKSRESHWVNRKPSGGPMRKGEQELFRKPNEQMSLKHLKPRVITVFKNEERNRKEKVYVNPVTKQTFEDLLITIGDMIEEEIHALYTEKKPYKKVESYSQLFNEFKQHNEFIACGPELYPSEKRTVPSSNSSSDSVSLMGRKKRFSRLNERGDLGELEENDVDFSMSPVPNMDHNGMLTSRDLPLRPVQRPLADDWVKCEIKGKDRYYYPPRVVYPDDDGGRPAKKLKLEWLYGYQGREGSKSLMVYEPTGELLYYMAAVAVFLWSDESADGDTQRHYLGHTDDITCLTIHPNEFLVASGQCSSKNSPAHIRIWDGRQLTTHHVIGLDFFVSGISAIDFSHQSSGNFMCVSDSSDKHILSVWDWQRERLIAKTTTTNHVVNCACFYKYDDTLLITYGAEHLYFWRLFWDPVIEREGKLYRDKLSGVLREVPKNVTAHAFASNGDVITGDSSGSIVVWTKDTEDVFRMNKYLSAHTHSVTSLCMMNDNTCLSGGGSYIKAWDNNFEFITERDMKETYGDVRAIIPQRRSGYDGKIYVGTSKSCIISGSLLMKFTLIVCGHSDEVWSIEQSPRELAFISGGQDRFVIKWAADRHRKVWRIEADAPVTAMSIDKDGQFVAVGTVIGRFSVLRVSSGEPLLSVHCSAAQINVMCYSPDCTKLALGTYDGYIHVFRVYDEGEHYRKIKIPLKGHQTFVNNLDWSGNSKYLRSCDAEFNEKFWNTHSMENEEGSTLRDCNWETHTCCADYSIMGPWTACEENESLSVVSRSHDRALMSVGDNKGRIKLYKYPSSKNMPSSRWTKLYSSTVTSLAFLCDDSYLLSSAGKYSVLAQWAVTDTATGHK